MKLLATALLALSCGVGPAPTPPGDTIVLLGADVFANGDRAARLLDDMAAATDVVGPARFEILTRDELRFDEFPDLLGQALDGDLGRRGVRAVIAIVGDLSVLDGVDPNGLKRRSPTLIRRAVDEVAFDRTLHRLAAVAEMRGVDLVLATAPLGAQGRIEVPELLELAERIEQRGPAIPLTGAFLELEATPMFSNRIDRLDDYGHDMLARLIWLALTQDPGPIAPRDEDERTARAEARALTALVGASEGAEDLALAALARPPTSPRSAARQAALASVYRIQDPAARWASIEAPADEPVPSLSVGRTMWERKLFPGQPIDPVERGIMAIFRRLALERADPHAEGPSAVDLGEALVAEFPHRLEAWIGLQIAAAMTLPRRDVRGEARDNLLRFPRSAVNRGTAERLLQSWPLALDALPAVLAGSRPYALMKPTGLLLDQARRRAAAGLTGTAIEILENGQERGRFPKSWSEELEALRADS